MALIQFSQRVFAYAAVVVTVLATLGRVPATATPAPPKPTVDSVMAQLDALAQQTEPLAEKYNAAQADIVAAQQAHAQALADARSADAGYQTSRAALSQLVATQYMSAPLGQFNALLDSDSSTQYLERAASLELLATHQTDVLTSIETTKNTATNAQQAAVAALATATTARDAVQKQQQVLIQQTAQFQNLLATLTSSQRQAYTGRNAATPQQLTIAMSTPVSSAAARAAVKYALAQVGKPYVFGAAGPRSFDCSGLTMSAWAAGGVSLPHLASAQYRLGRHVARSDLQPGDLVFLYSDIHHVELYIGNGLAVSAPQEGENVKIIQLAAYQRDYLGATRLT